jgi:hypothetical protein
LEERRPETTNSTLFSASMANQDHNYIGRNCKHHLKSICTDKKENQIFLINKEIQSVAVAKSYDEGLPNI